MTLASMQLDPNAQAYTDDQIVGKVNAATDNITRASSVTSAALADGSAKANLDAMADVDRAYVKTDPVTGEYKVTAVQRAANGKLEVDYDDTPIP